MVNFLKFVLAMILLVGVVISSIYLAPAFVTVIMFKILPIPVAYVMCVYQLFQMPCTCILAIGLKRKLLCPLWKGMKQ